MVGRNINISKMAASVRWAFNWKEWSPTEKDFSHAVSCIQLEEKERLGRFVFRKDVRSSLIGRLMMRKFVNEYAQIPYNKIVFERDEHNRPILSTTVPLSFSVSHQGNYTVLAGELRNMKLGVDVMKLEYTGGRSLSEFFRIMDRTFSSSEWKEIKGTKETTEFEQVAMFCRHWALKESYVKALGIGIVIDLRNLDFKTHSKLIENSVVTDTVFYLNNVKQDWLFQESLLNSDHCVAVAMEKKGETLESVSTAFEEINYDKLIEYSIPLFPEDLDYTKKYFMKDEMP